MFVEGRTVDSSCIGLRPIDVGEVLRRKDRWIQSQRKGWILGCKNSEGYVVAERQFPNPCIRVQKSLSLRHSRARRYSVVRLSSWDIDWRNPQRHVHRLSVWLVVSPIKE